MSLLAAKRLCKSYGNTRVLHELDFDLRPGEIHALVGENGAGKSTLCRIIAGITQPESGAMHLDGHPHCPRSRGDAQAAGVHMVMQELNLLPTLTIAENIYLDSMPRRFGVIDYRAMNAAAASAIADVGLESVRPEQLLATLGVGQCQLVEIAAALSRSCRVLVLDEPTAALTTPQIALLFARIRRLKDQGAGILYVSHRLEEIRAIADRITILRDGRRIATRSVNEITESEIIRLMVGRDLSESPRSAQRTHSEVMMSVRRLSRRPLVRDVTFDLHAGEILGFAGLMGSGRTETMRAIFAADQPDSGEILLRGAKTPARIRSPRHAVRQGIALLTEDRKSQGLLLPLALDRNTTLARMSAVSRFKTWINRSRETALAVRYIDTLSIRCRSPRQPVNQLSGGNQQKVVLAKWLLRDCDILIFDEPTRGIDVGAKFEIYKLLDDLAARGKAVIVVSSDLLELTAIADRIAVMSAGRLVRIFDRGQWTQERILDAALSGYKQPGA